MLKPENLFALFQSNLAVELPVKSNIIPKNRPSKICGRQPLKKLK